MDTKHASIESSEPKGKSEEKTGRRTLRSVILAMAMLAGLVTTVVAAPAPASANCSFDYVKSARVLSSWNVSPRVQNLSIALQGPGTVSAQWGSTRSNTISGSTELTALGRAFRVGISRSYSYSASQSHSFQVPRGKYGKVQLVTPRKGARVELTWSRCGSWEEKQTVNRTIYVDGQYTRLATRNNRW